MVMVFKESGDEIEECGTNSVTHLGGERGGEGKKGKKEKEGEKEGGGEVSNRRGGKKGRGKKTCSRRKRVRNWEVNCFGGKVE